MSELVQTPTPEEERPRLGIALAIATVSFAVGVAFVCTLPGAPKPSSRPVVIKPGADAQQPEPAGTIAVPRPIAPTTTPPVEVTSPAPTNASSNGTQQPPAAAASPMPHEDAPTTPDPVTKRAPNADSALTMIQGRVAYLRCDGLRNENGRFPCPRDAALEQAVWDVLATLPRCSPSLGRGGVDVRLDLVRGEQTQVRTLAIAGSPEPALDNARVYACVGSRLARLTTTLDPIYMMVSFRAALR